jgi:hypothetical protein
VNIRKGLQSQLLQLVRSLARKVQPSRLPLLDIVAPHLIA